MSGAHDWLGHVQPVGLVVAPAKLDEIGLFPLPQDAADTEEVGAALSSDDGSSPDAWTFLSGVLSWPAARVFGAPGGPAMPDGLTVALRDGETVLAPTYAVATVDGGAAELLVRVEEPSVALDRRGALPGWEATPHQRFERLLRETGVPAGVLIGGRDAGRSDGALELELRLVAAPPGETSGWIAWPLTSLATVAGREMLGGLKMLLGREAIWTNPPHLRLLAVLDASRKAQANVSERLSGQVLAALHELLRGFDAADPELVRHLARTDPHGLYEGLLTVLMRLIFILYAEDRGLMPSVPGVMPNGGVGAELYERGYSVGGLLVKLEDDEALNPDTMDERVGAWGRLLALFRLVSRGHDGFMQRRGGRLFDEQRFPFLLGRAGPAEPERVLSVSDGCVLRVLTSLATLGNPRTGERERLSYRTLDVEQIGSVYETVMGFTVEEARGPMLAIRAGKNNKTPVFVDLAALVGDKPAERAKRLKEDTGRGQFPAAVARALRDATDVPAIAAALAPVADPRGSPRQEPCAAGAPILQPTDERRRTGSHYTPRSLTAPIVTHALEPVFERIGPDATPAQVLDLKVCDPAVGSGAFLVEACRQLGLRLVRAWEAHPDLKPPIPADEDDELHARRLVAQRCLYGVDRNPMALDLAKLSLWLATLARDHEFSFLDHALKGGDSLVGLSRAQIEAASWDASALPGLWRARVRQDVGEAIAHRDAIRNAPDEVALAMQEAQHARVERGLGNVRLIGDAVIATFFAHDRPRARTNALAEVSDRAGGGDWNWLRNRATSLADGTHPVRPFHWEIEFPEVFARDNPGFDAIVGNPPFAGRNTIIGGNRSGYLDWLQTLHTDAHSNADLVAHFFRRAFTKLREGGAFGLIATNTIRQGDTRDSGLRRIIKAGGTIYRAVGRHKWEGDAAVVVAMVFVAKGLRGGAVLNGRTVRRISAYLVEGTLDASPMELQDSKSLAFEGVKIYGSGFTFDDRSAAKGKSLDLLAMNDLLHRDQRNVVLVKPYLGGEEVANDPQHQHSRYVIDFGERPLERTVAKAWQETTDRERSDQLRSGVVSYDYPGEVARDWPDLIDVVERYVRPERQTPDKAQYYRMYHNWWKYWNARPELTAKLAELDHVLIICRVSPHVSFARVAAQTVFADSLDVFALSTHAAFATLQSRVHEVWARFFASSMKDDLRYTPSDCFETFPLPPDFDNDPALEASGQAYHDHRAQLMIARDQGMTPTYNRFHREDDTATDITTLRALHADMDRAVLRAYGWDDLAERAAPEFLTEVTEDDHAYQGRLHWPAPFRDELLARLLRLNAERAEEERLAGLA